MPSDQDFKISTGVELDDDPHDQEFVDSIADNNDDAPRPLTLDELADGCEVSTKFSYPGVTIEAKLKPNEISLFLGQDFLDACWGVVATIKGWSASDNGCE